jgi:hypothetical protein
MIYSTNCKYPFNIGFYTFFISLFINTISFSQKFKEDSFKTFRIAKIDSLLILKADFENDVINFQELIDEYRIQLNQKKSNLELLSIELESEIIKLYGLDIGYKIKDGKIWTGMTEQMFIHSRREKPDTVNRSGKIATYLFGNLEFIFENGILKKWKQ